MRIQNFNFSFKSLLAVGVMVSPFGSGQTPNETVQSAFNKISAQSYSAMRGLDKYSTYMKSFDATDYLGFSKVDFGSGAKSLVLNMSAEKRDSPQVIEVRLDSVDGPLIGRHIVIPTGSWGNFAPQYVNITPTTGIRDVFLVGQGGTGIGNIKDLKFLKQSPPSPLIYGNFNSLDLILDDMRLKNDLPIKNIKATGAWAKGPGNIAVGSDATRAAPWGEVFIGEGNQATNSKVQFRHFKVYWQRKSDRTWHHLRDFSTPQGSFYGTDKYVDSQIPAETWDEGSGVFSVAKPIIAPNVSWTHFWSQAPYGTDLPEPLNVRAIMITAQFRLVLMDPNGPDDRDSALYMVRVGADDPNHRKPGYILQIVGSRGKKALKHWQSITAFTFDKSVGVDVWDNVSDDYGITEAEFRAHPPPLD